MTPKQLKKNPIRPIIKVKPYQKLDTDEGESVKDEGESTTSTELTEDSISDTSTEDTEDSKPVETCQLPNVFIKSTDNEADSPTLNSTSEFELPKVNGEQNIVQDNKLVSTNFTVETQNQKVEGLITYSFDQHISKFKVCNGHKESQETTNSDKLTNLELWGANADFKSYEQKRTIDGIFQHMGFYPPTKNPCVMTRENL